MSDKKYTPEEIKEAIEYLRGERNLPTSDIELARNALEKEQRFVGCTFLLLGVLIAGTVGALASGHPGGGLVLLTITLGFGYLVWIGRKEIAKKQESLEDLKRRKLNAGD